MRQAYEKKKREWEELKAAYHERLHSHHLDPLEDKHYSNGIIGPLYEPRSKESWELHRVLIQLEGNDSESEISKIEEGLLTIKIHEVEKEILESMSDEDLVPSVIWGDDPVSKKYLGTVLGRDELTWYIQNSVNWNNSNTPLYPSSLTAPKAHL